MDQPRKKCLPMYPAALNPCAKLPTNFADQIDTEGSVPHLPSGPTPEPGPTPAKKPSSKSKGEGKTVGGAIAAAISGGTASGAITHTGRQAFKEVPTSRLNRPSLRTPNVSNPANPPEVEMTQRPSISDEGLRSRGGIPRGTIAEEAPLLETETAEAAGAEEASGGLFAAMGAGAGTAEEFGGVEAAPETMGLSVAAAAVGGALAGGATYLFGHHHHHH